MGKTLYVTIAVDEFIPGNGTDAVPAISLTTWDERGSQEYDETNTGVRMCGYDVQLNSQDKIRLTAIFSESIK